MRKPRPIAPSEPLAPWMAASVVAIGAYIAGVLVGTSSSAYHRIVFTIGVCAVVCATQLVLHRAKRADELARRDLGSRPAREELAGVHSAAPLAVDPESTLPPYATGMLAYSRAVIELLEHGVQVTLAHGVDPSELAAGRDDAAALNDLLRTMAMEPVHLRKAAKVHTICSLWETNQERLEQLAVDLDPEFHRRWRARHVSALRMRHGEAPARVETPLPYRDVMVTK